MIHTGTRSTGSHRQARRKRAFAFTDSGTWVIWITVHDNHNKCDRQPLGRVPPYYRGWTTSALTTRGGAYSYEAAVLIDRTAMPPRRTTAARIAVHRTAG